MSRIRRIKRLVSVFLAAFTAVALLGLVACDKEDDGVTTDDREGTKEVPPDNEEFKNEGEFTIANGETYAVLRIKDYGNIYLKLFPEYAPKAVQNFIDLAESGYYDGKVFHRILQDFMIQGGSPNGDGLSSPGYPNFSIEPHGDAVHSYGALSMANAGPDSNAEQFFIVNAKAGAHFLDGSYSVFGHIVDGYEVLDSVSGVKVELDPSSGETSKPVKPVAIEYVKIKVLDDPNAPAAVTQAVTQAPEIEEGVGNASGDVKLEKGDTYAVIDIKGFGEITVKLFPDCAPVAVKNFIDLAESGYYDGKVFHRIIKDFMIQGGSPNGDGKSDPDYDDYFSIEPNINAVHVYGALSMANAGPDRNSQQFFIVNAEEGSRFLDGNYTVFGQTVDGFDVLIKVSDVKVEMSDSGEESQPVEPVIIESVKILTYDGESETEDGNEAEDEDEDEENED